MKPDHPLYVVGKGWTPVCDIRPRDTLLTAEESIATIAPALSRRRRLPYVTRNIEDILPGDFILSRDQNNPDGPLVYSRVDKVYRRLADHLRILRIRDFARRGQTLKTTDDHPYCVPRKGWIKARDLEIGDVFFGLDGACGVLTGTVREEHPDGVWVYNLRVEGTHTYFVREKGVDADPVWVHNANYTPNSQLQEWANEQGGFVDPRTNQWVATNDPLAADHVYPKSLIEKLPGFEELTPAQQDWLMNYPGNFEPLPKAWNSSKLNRLADDWATTPMGRQASVDYINNLRDRQTAFEGFASQTINFWLGK